VPSIPKFRLVSFCLSEIRNNHKSCQNLVKTLVILTAILESIHHCTRYVSFPAPCFQCFYCLSAFLRLPVCRLPQALETAERQNVSAAAETFLPPLICHETLNRNAGAAAQQAVLDELQAGED
jgi:hypothetical protein